MNTRRLQGQKAIVTGASSGIGKAVAIALGAHGADVAVNFFSNEDGAEEACQAIRDSGSDAFAIQGNVSREDEVKHIFNAARDRFGRLDILVSNAGIQQDAPFLEMSLEQWEKVIGVNLTGGFLCAREAAKVFIKQGVNTQISQSAGKIIFMSSVHETIPWAGHINYAAAKGGIKMLMKSLTQELAGHKIRINGIGPGAIKTEINKAVWTDEEQKNKLLGQIPYGRIGEPEEIGRAAAWLASDEADYINGITLFIDGGMLVYPAFAESG